MLTNKRGQIYLLAAAMPVAALAGLPHAFKYGDASFADLSSGGRRLDFEAVSRSHSYCRTDYAIGPHNGPLQVLDVQNVTLNTLACQTFQRSETTPARFLDDYGFFSSLCAGSVFTPSDWNAGIVKNDFMPEQTAWCKKVFAVADRPAVLRGRLLSAH